MPISHPALQKLFNRQYIHSRAIPPTPPTSLDFWLKCAAIFHCLLLGVIVAFYSGNIALFFQTLALVNQLGGSKTVSIAIDGASQGLSGTNISQTFSLNQLPYILSGVGMIGFIVTTVSLLLMIRTKKKFGVNSVQFDRLLVLFVSGYLVWIVCTVGSFIPAQIFGGK